MSDKPNKKEKKQGASKSFNKKAIPQDANETVEDSRFSHFASDPRFRPVSRKQRAIEIDDRFQSMFAKNSSFASEYVDSRGAPRKHVVKTDMKRFYRLEGESDEDNKDNEADSNEEEDNDEVNKPEAPVSASRNKSAKQQTLKSKKAETKRSKAKPTKRKDEDDEVDEDDEDDEDSHGDDSGNDQLDLVDIDFNNIDQNKFAVDYSRGEVLMSSSDEESEADLEGEEDEGEDIWAAQDHNDVVRTEDVSKRLAICNLDWDNVNATDLFVLCNSFKPSNGVLQSVSIYPSEFGLQRMKEEDSKGPMRFITGIDDEQQQQLKDDEQHDDQDEEDQEEDDDDDLSSAKKKEIDANKLRQYEMQKFKYYYAVVVCDTPETATAIYDAIDGQEYELSANLIDCRFIPDDTTFDHEPKEVATNLPGEESYQPARFTSQALQMSNVSLTWDETDAKRLQITQKRQFTNDDLKTMDFSALLASDSDHDEVSDNEEEKSSAAKYKNLIAALKAKKEAEKPEDDMEITFDLGLKENTEKLVKKKKEELEEQDLTVGEKWDLEKKRWKAEKRREKRKQLKDEEEKDEDAANPHPAMDDPFFQVDFGEEFKEQEGKDGKEGKKKKGKLNKEERAEKNRDASELALLMDDSTDKNHFNITKLAKDFKQSQKKKQKKKNQEQSDDFSLDLEDDRFKSVFTSRHFHIDQSDPKFIRTKAMQSLIDERQKRVTQIAESPQQTTTAAKVDTDQTKLDALVKSIKSKSAGFDNKRRKF